MVDWSLARQVARFAAGTQETSGAPVDLSGTCAELEGRVAAYTGLELASPAPAPELVSRRAWAEINLDSMAKLLDPVAERVETRLDAAGPLAGALKIATATALAAEVGLVSGYLAQRVIGQYEISLLGGNAPPRLLFVGANMDKAIGDLDVDEDSFRRWICAHELTHVFQFQGVPWLRDHLGSLIHEYLSTVEVRIARGGARVVASLPDPSELVAAFREGGLAGLVQNDEQREVMSRVQCAMAVVEGYSEHVMDVIAAEVIPDHEQLRSAMDARRADRSAPQRIIERLLGLHVKLRQYEQGKRFCDAVVGEGGMALMNLVWESPAGLPTLAELEHPADWTERVSRPREALGA